MPYNEKRLQKKADRIRRELIGVAVKNGAGHIAPSLSCVDILTALYYGVMRYKSSNPIWSDRDRLIFSKSHGCYALYAILADKGVIPDKEWKKFYSAESSLLGCAEYRLDYGLEAGCGSLGHGLPLAVGQAFAAKLEKRPYDVFCLIGDGEMQEGTTWEALQFAVKHEIGNLIIIVDNNKLQAMDFIVNVLDRTIRDNIKKLRGFGLSPVVCDGHSAAKIARRLNSAKKSSSGSPRVIIAETIKGYGLKHMENVPKFHFRIPSARELKQEKIYARCP